MLSKPDALIIVQRAFPNADIKFMTEYKGLFIYRVLRFDDPEEGDMDPFFSVHRSTGEFRDFSILTDISPADLRRLFPTS